MPGILLYRTLLQVLLHDMLTRDYLIDRGFCLWFMFMHAVTLACS